MIKEKLKRTTLRTLLLLASFLAISQSSWAASLWMKGTLPFDGRSGTNDWEAIIDNNVYVTDITISNAGDYYFSLWDAERTHNFAPKDNNTTYTLGTTLTYNGSSIGNYDNGERWKVYLERGVYRFTYNNSVANAETLKIEKVGEAHAKANLYLKIDDSFDGVKSTNPDIQENMDLVEGKLVYTFTPTASKNYYLLYWDATNNRNVGADTSASYLNIEPDGAVHAVKYEQKPWQFYGIEGHEYTITYDGDNGTVSVSTDSKPAENYDVKIYGKFDGRSSWSATTVALSKPDSDDLPEGYSVYSYTVSDTTGDIRFRVNIDGVDYRATGNGLGDIIDDTNGGVGTWNDKVKYITRNKLQELSTSADADNCWAVNNIGTQGLINLTIHVDAYKKQMWVTYDEKPCEYSDLQIYGNFQPDRRETFKFFDGVMEDNVMVYYIDNVEAPGHLSIDTSGPYEFTFYSESTNHMLVPESLRETTLNGVRYAVDSPNNFNEDNTFTYNFSNSKKYKISVTGTNVRVEELPIQTDEHDVWISGLDGSFGKGNLTNAVWDNDLKRYVANYKCTQTRQLTVNGVTYDVVNFRVKIDDVTYTTTDLLTHNIPLGSYEDIVEGSKGQYWFYACPGAEYNIYVDAEHKQVRVAQLRCNHEGAPHLVVALTGLAEDWSAYDINLATQLEDNTHVYVHEATDRTMTFRVRLSGREYTPGTVENITARLGEKIEIGPAVQSLVAEDMIGKPEAQQSAAGYYRVDSTVGMRYKFTVTPEYDEEAGENKYYLTVEAIGMPPLTEWGMPVVPARVADRRSQEEWAKVTADRPAVYLLAEVLNGNRVNPEWEMIYSEADGLYHLDNFTMRNTELKIKDDQNSAVVRTGAKASVRYYTSVDDKNGTLAWSEVVKPVYGNEWDQEIQLFPGMRYNATYNHQTKEVVFIPNNAKYTYKDGATTYTAPPFIAVVGDNFKLLDANYDTPRETADTNTDQAWQESRILFDANGDVMFDTHDQVMYSTKFPPANPSYFNLEVNGQNIEVRTTNIRMNVQSEGEGETEHMVVKSGKEWKELLGSDPAYEYLFKKREGVASTHGATAVTALNDDDLYARYVVENLWILGVNKIWSGWSGSEVDGGDANWSNHINWGFGPYKGWNSDPAGSNIDINTAYKLGTKNEDNGNFDFGDPQYFKTMELFYNVKHGSDNQVVSALNYSVLYTTQGYGQPTINARSVKNEHKIATVDLNIADLPEGAVVKDFKVRRINSVKDVDADGNLQYCDKTGNIVDNKDDASVILISKEAGTSDITTATLKDRFNDAYNFEMPVTNDEGLARGRYYYELEVTFGVPAAEGTEMEERIETVTSAIVSIYNNNVYTRPRAYQLIRNFDSTLKDAEGKQFNYVTFSRDRDAMFGLQIEFDGDSSTPEYYGMIHYEPITLTEAQKKSYYLNPSKCSWTNKVFIFCELPNELKNLTEGTDYELVNYTLNELDDVDVLLAQKIRRYKADGTGTAKYAYADKSYAAIIVFPGIDTHSFSITPNYYNIDSKGVLTRGESTPVVETFTYTYPVPEVTNVVFDLENTVSDTQMKVTHDEKTYTFGGDYERNLKATVYMSGFNIEEDEKYPACQNLFEQIYPYFKGWIRMDHGDVEGTETRFYLQKFNEDDGHMNAIVLNNLDPTDWLEFKNGSWVVKSGNIFHYDCNFQTQGDIQPGDPVSSSLIHAYPDAPGWNTMSLALGGTANDLRIEKPVHTDGEGHPTVYRYNAQIGDNLYEQRLVLSKHPIYVSDQDYTSYRNIINGQELTVHDNSYVMFTVDGKPLSTGLFEQLSILNSADEERIIAKSEPFHWYAEMERDKRVGTERVNFALRYAYFFKGDRNYETRGIIRLQQPTKQEIGKRRAAGVTDRRPYMAAPARAKANEVDTHVMITSPVTSSYIYASDILTGVSDVEMDMANPVTTGRGWINVEADSAEVYNTAGVQVAGAGRTDIAAGIYMVKVAGRTYKVVVK